MEKFKCVICKKHVKEFGNNPAPVASRGLCCDKCNVEVVLPIRMQQEKEIKK